MKHIDHTVRREATLTQTTYEDDVVRGHYRWNTGEISQISVPANFHFDPSSAVRPAQYAQSLVATSAKTD